MKASIIVCTRNRAGSISETLTALSQLEAADYEILIVDSSSGSEKEKTAELAKQFGAKYVPEPRPGLSLARNTGVTVATGEIIVFTDDDCVPQKDWLRLTVNNFSTPEIWACTARIIQQHTGGASDLFEEVAGQDLGGEKRIFTPKDVQGGFNFLFANIGKIFAKHMKSRAPAPFGIGHGSSLAFRREAFQKLGGFDVRFGAGAPLKGCDDLEMLYRILKSGHSIVYEPAAIVKHKHRLTSDAEHNNGARSQDTQNTSADEVFKTRYVYSFSGAAFMREFRNNPQMFFMFYGRLVQLMIKNAQYKLTGKKDLAQSFNHDLRGFLDGIAAHKKYSKVPK
ncbi:MAG TPA: glycosyltransferase [Verrucomicrobiae bacterium]|jgi:glycosyltransferase involved in cell wall biosynthesis